MQRSQRTTREAEEQHKAERRGVGALAGAAFSLAALIAVFLAGCGSSGPSSSPSAGARLAPTKGPYSPSLDPANFGGPIDNPYLPLRPGTTFRYRGVGDDGKTPELNTVAVTRRKKRTMGIEATVVLDEVFAGGKPEERTLDWYAQDRQGNVWYLGEDSRNYEHGRWVRDEGSWQAGVGDSKPGIIMVADPRPGDAYRQEYSPGHALDQARVLGPGGALKVPYRNFSQTLATREYSSIDHRAERKYYAPGVGVVKEEGLAPGKERSELVALTRAG